jgi:hypothetical protein
MSSAAVNFDKWIKVHKYRPLSGLIFLVFMFVGHPDSVTGVKTIKPFSFVTRRSGQLS